MRRFTWLGALVASTAAAAPFDLTHTGRVLDATGAPVNGPTALTVTLYHGAGASTSWSFPSVDLQDGYFTVVLDGVETSWLSGTVEIGVAVGGGPELSPRQVLASVPRAHVARGLEIDAAGTGSTCASEGQLVWDAVDRAVKVCDGSLWLPIGGVRTIVDFGGVRRWSDGTAAASCDAYRHPTGGASYAGDVGDGVYWIDPDGPGPIAAVDLYCDMTTDGGGWTVIGKVGAGDFTALSDAAYTDLVANPTAHVGLAELATPGSPAPGTIAWLDRPFTNALHDASTVRVVRVDFTEAQSVNVGRYYQRRVNAPDGFDLWHALRDSTLWGDGSVVSTYYVGGFGTVFKLNKGAVWSEATRDFPHGGDGTFGFWDNVSVTLNTGEVLSVSRHAGLLCDGWNNAPNQWMFTSNPADSRWKNDDPSKRTVVWFR